MFELYNQLLCNSDLSVNAVPLNRAFLTSLSGGSLFSTKKKEMLFDFSKLRLEHSKYSNLRMGQEIADCE